MNAVLGGRAGRFARWKNSKNFQLYKSVLLPAPVKPSSRSAKSPPWFADQHVFALQCPCRLLPRKASSGQWWQNITRFPSCMHTLSLTLVSCSALTLWWFGAKREWKDCTETQHSGVVVRFEYHPLHALRRREMWHKSSQTCHRPKCLLPGT